MVKGDKFVILREANAEMAKSPTARAVAALTALGIPFAGPRPYTETREMVDGKPHVVRTWVLATLSADGKHETAKLFEAYQKPTFAQEFPEHPLAYIKTAFANHDRLMDVAAAQVPLAVVRKGNSFAMIPLDATPERREELLNALEK